MNICKLNKCRETVQEVPHLIIDWFSLNYPTDVLRLCINYKVQVLEITEFEDDFVPFHVVPFYSPVIGVETAGALFAHSLRKIIRRNTSKGPLEVFSFMLDHSAVRYLELDLTFYKTKTTSPIAADSHRNRIYNACKNNNYHLQQFEFVCDGTRVVPWDQSLSKANKAMSRNRRLYLHKYTAALMLVGISKFRSRSLQRLNLCKDIMTIIARMVSSTHPKEVQRLSGEKDELLTSIDTEELEDGGS